MRNNSLLLDIIIRLLNPAVNEWNGIFAPLSHFLRKRKNTALFSPNFVRFDYTVFNIVIINASFREVIHEKSAVI